jgi:outer membrane protein with beta-barrel domain
MRPVSGRTDRFLESSRALALVLAVTTSIASRAAEIHPMIKVGIDTGGDTLITLLFSDGSTETIKANQGFYVGGGVSIVNASRDLELEVSLSFKYTSAYGTKGEIDWTRYPLDALVFYRWTRMRLGGGLTYHLNPRLKGSGDVGGLNVMFDNAPGLALQADYRITDQFTAGVRYTAVEYETSSNPATATKSSGLGITLGMSF